MIVDKITMLQNKSNLWFVHISDYTTIQRMTIPRLTKWRPDFDILMIQRLFFFEKKGQKFFPTPHGFHLKTFPTP